MSKMAVLGLLGLLSCDPKKVMAEAVKDPVAVKYPVTVECPSVPCSVPHNG